MAYNIDKPDAIFAAKRDFSNVNSGVGRNALGLGSGDQVSFGSIRLFDGANGQYVSLTVSDAEWILGGIPGQYGEIRFNPGTFTPALNFGPLTQNRNFFFPDQNGTILLENGNGSQLTGISSSQIGAQPASANLSGFNNSTGVGFPVRTALNTWANRGLTAPAAGITISNPSGISGNPTFALSNDLSGLENLSSTGIAVRTATDTWAQRGLVGPAAGITISNSDGVAGNPTFSLANDLLGLENLSSTGFPVRTASDTWAQREIGVVGPLTITNPAGVAGNPTISVSGATTGASGVVPGLGGTTSTNAATVAQANAANLDGAVLALGTLSSAGNSDIAPAAATVRRLLATATIDAGSAAYVRTLTLTSTNAQAGDERVLRVALPANLNPVVEIRNLTSSGTLLNTILPALGEARSVTRHYRFDGVNWEVVAEAQRVGIPSAILREALDLTRAIPINFIGGSSSVAGSATVSGNATNGNYWVASPSLTTANSAARWRSNSIPGVAGTRSVQDIFRRSWSLAFEAEPQMHGATGGLMPDARIRYTLYGRFQDAIDAAAGASVGLANAAGTRALGFEVRPSGNSCAWWGWIWDGTTLNYYDLGYLTDSGGGQGGRITSCAVAGDMRGRVIFWVDGAVRAEATVPAITALSASNYPVFQMSATTGATANGNNPFYAAMGRGVFTYL